MFTSAISQFLLQLNKNAESRVDGMMITKSGKLAFLILSYLLVCFKWAQMVANKRATYPMANRNPIKGAQSSPNSLQCPEMHSPIDIDDIIDLKEGCLMGYRNPVRYRSGRPSESTKQSNQSEGSKIGMYRQSYSLQYRKMRGELGSVQMVHRDVFQS
jgi:hypothetical protein